MVATKNSQPSAKRAPVAKRVKLTPALRIHPHSRVNRIAELEVGATEAMAVRISSDKVGVKTVVANKVIDVRSTLSKSANVAEKRSGHNYTTEIMQAFTASGDIMVIGVVTRVK